MPSFVSEQPDKDGGHQDGEPRENHQEHGGEQSSGKKDPTKGGQEKDPEESEHENKKDKKDLDNKEDVQTRLKMPAKPRGMGSRIGVYVAN